MRIHSFTVGMVVAAAVLSTVLTWGATTAVIAQSTAVAGVPDTAEEDAAFSAVCAVCHDASLVEGPFRTAAEWEATIGVMQSYGASGSEAQLALVRSYLLRGFGRANVNTATATDLAPVLNVSAELAEAVVTYRRDNGNFTGLDDLRKVPGLVPERLDARTARLTF